LPWAVVNGIISVSLLTIISQYGTMKEIADEAHQTGVTERLFAVIFSLFVNNHHSLLR